MLRVVPTILTLALTVYAVVDCVQSDEQRIRGLPKVIWAFLILLFPIAGPVAWFIAGRPRRLSNGPRPRSAPPRGPDDDPDFLNRL